jgi:DNA primase large subunit
MSQQLKYPFSVGTRKAAQKLARDLRILISFVESRTNTYIIEAAEKRVLAALDQSEIPLVHTGEPGDVLIYPTARLIVEKIGDPRLREYQAEAESKAVNKHLGKEKEGFVTNLCQSAFGWHVESAGTIRERAKLPIQLRTFEFKLRYEDFLEVAPAFHQSPWKLINRYVDKGWVPVQRLELNRLVSGKFKLLILHSTLDVPTLPQRLTESVQRVETDLRGKIRTTTPVKLTGDAVSAFPPCISNMHDDATQGKNLSHEARFALASFLLKIGMSEEEVLGVFKAAPDFVRGLAEYQVKHIASKAAGEGYTPPGCSKLQGNSLCPVYLGTAKDPLCQYVQHPLAFYQTRAWEVSKGIDNHSWYATKKRKRQSL